MGVSGDPTDVVLVTSLGQADLRGDPDGPAYRALLRAVGGAPPGDLDPARLAELERRLPSRQRARFMAEHYDEPADPGRRDGPRYGDTIRLPILAPVLAHIRREVGAAARLTLYLIATDQRPPGMSEADAERDAGPVRNDTHGLGRVVTRWLNEHQARVGTVDVRGVGVSSDRQDDIDRLCRVTANPADYGVYWRLEPLFAALAERHPHAALYVNVTAGTPGITFALLLNGIRRFPGACTVLYVPDDGAGGQVQQIPIGRDIWRELTRARPPAARLDLPPWPAVVTPPMTGATSTLRDGLGVDDGGIAVAMPPRRGRRATAPSWTQARESLHRSADRLEAQYRAGDGRRFLIGYGRLLRRLLLSLAVMATGIDEATPEALQHWATGEARLSLHGQDSRPAEAARAALGSLGRLRPRPGPVAAACLDRVLPALAAVDPTWRLPAPVQLDRDYVGLFAAPAPSINRQNVALDQLRAATRRDSAVDIAIIDAAYARSFFGVDGADPPVLADLRRALALVMALGHGPG